MFNKLGAFLKSKFTKGKIASFVAWVFSDPTTAKQKVVDEVKETVKGK
jgi:hypothetical protein